MKAKERHEIKTDRFLEIMMRAEEFFVDHAKAIALTILGLVLAAAVWIGAAWYFDSREQTASVALNGPMSEFAELQPGEQNDAERLAGLGEKFSGVIADHGGTAAAVIARYYLGLVRLQENKAEEAADAFRSVIDSRHPTFWTLASKELGDLLMKQGNAADAAGAYAAVADSNGENVPRAFFAYRAGESYEAAGDKNLALLYYNKAKESQNLTLDASIVNRIDRRIQELNEQ